MLKFKNINLLNFPKCMAKTETFNITLLKRPFPFYPLVLCPTLWQPSGDGHLHLPGLMDSIIVGHIIGCSLAWHLPYTIYHLAFSTALDQKAK